MGLVETVWNDKVHGDKFTKRKLKVTFSRELRLPTGPLIWHVNFCHFLSHLVSDGMDAKLIT